MKNLSVLVAVCVFVTSGFISGCKAQSQENNVPEEKVKQAYFASITCQGDETRAQYDEAERYCKMGISELEGYTHPLQEPLYSALIDIYLHQNKYVEAEQLQRKMIDLTAHLDGKQSPNYAIALAAYGQSMIRDAKFSESEPYIDEALPLLKSMPEQAKRLSWSVDWYLIDLNNKVMLKVNQQNEPQALEVLKQWIAYRGHPNPTDFELRMGLAHIYAEVGEIYYTQPKPNLSKAQVFYEKALSSSKQAYSQLPKVQRNQQLGIKTQVIPMYDIVVAGHHLADVYQRTGQSKQAAALGCTLKNWDVYYRFHPPAHS